MEKERFIAETEELSGEYQVVLPEEVRTILDIHENDKLQFILVGDHVVVRTVKSKSILDVLGSWEPNKPILDVKELRDQYRKKLIEDEFSRQSPNHSDEL